MSDSRDWNPERLEDLLDARGLTQAELCRRVGIHPKSLSRAKLERKISSTVLRQIATELSSEPVNPVFTALVENTPVGEAV